MAGNVNFCLRLVWTPGLQVDIIGYMSQNNTTRGWWNYDADPTERAALAIAYRERQRVHRAAGWRRNILIGVMVVAVPLLIRIWTT
jgi:hypothetical protein